MLTFEWLYNTFNNMLRLGGLLWGFFTMPLFKVGGIDVPLWGLLLSGGLTAGLVIRLVRNIGGFD